MNNSKIAEILTHLMSEKGMRVTELARRVNLPQPTIYRIVTGACANPHLSSLQPIADFFSITVNQLRGIDPIHSLEKISKVPLIYWNEAISWTLNVSNITAHTMILTDANISRYAYSLQVQDESMEPVFLKGTFLILDPEKIPTNRSYVVVKLSKFPQPIFRQLILDVQDRYLKPLTPDLEQYKMIRINNNDKILSTLVQAKRDY